MKSKRSRNLHILLPVVMVAMTGALPSAAAQEATEAETTAQPEAAGDLAAVEKAEVTEEPAAEEPAIEETASGEPTEKEPVVEETAPEVPAAVEEKKEDWTDRITLKADFRYRFETIKKGDADLRYRHRIRLAPALIGRVFEDLDVGIGLGTGGPDGSHGEGDVKSNNQTLTHGFSSKYVWLDKAYLDYHPSWLPGIELTAGKMKNPLYRVGKSELLWDPDLNPEGIALNYQRKHGIFEPFVHAVSYFVEERKAADDTWLLGAQAGFKLHLADGMFYVLAGGRYMDYTHIQGTAPIWDAEDAFGNSTEELVDDEGNPYIALAHDYNIAGGFAEVGGKIVKLPWGVFADVAANTAVDEENTGWLVGAYLGKAKKQLDFHLRYIYREVEADAVYGLLTDSDFAGGGTGGKGHEWNFVFALHDRVQFAASYFYNKFPLEPTEESPQQDFHRTQFDIKMKF